MNFFDKHKALHLHQYSFRDKHSTEHAILDILSTCYNALESNPLQLMLDLKRAFDTVDHKIFLQKLQWYGIRGVASDLIKNFLCNRNQYVSLNNVTSSLKEVTYGVPQRSVLGPLLFLVYTNDLPNCSIDPPRLYADDTCLILHGHSLQNLELNCNKALKHVSVWMKVSKLTVNTSKSQVIVLFPKSSDNTPHFNVMMNQEKISCCSNLKYLGLFIDEHLDFRKHLTYIEAKLARAVEILYKCKAYFSTKILRMLYFFLMYPHLTHGIIVWRPSFKRDVKKIEVLQNKAIRAIANAKFKQRLLPLYHQLDILPPKQINALQLGKFMHKSFMSSTPPYISSFLTSATTPLLLN